LRSAGTYALSQPISRLPKMNEHARMKVM
jgi:hypothetical protein